MEKSIGHDHESKYEDTKKVSTFKHNILLL